MGMRDHYSVIKQMLPLLLRLFESLVMLSGEKRTRLGACASQGYGRQGS
jgi:hypothetical protein